MDSFQNKHDGLRLEAGLEWTWIQDIVLKDYFLNWPLQVSVDFLLMQGPFKPEAIHFGRNSAEALIYVCANISYVCMYLTYVDTHIRTRIHTSHKQCTRNVFADCQYWTYTYIHTYTCIHVDTRQTSKTIHTALYRYVGIYTYMYVYTFDKFWSFACWIFDTRFNGNQ